MIQFDGSQLARTSNRDAEWREKGGKELGHDIYGPNQKTEEETRGLGRVCWGLAMTRAEAEQLVAKLIKVP